MEVYSTIMKYIILIVLLFVGCSPQLQQENKIDNKLAIDVSYMELNIFLDRFQSTTCKEKHTTNSCVYFAQLLHNEAERNGIRTAIAIVDSKNHVFNLFVTELGNIYVDSTNGIVGIATNECGIYKVTKGTQSQILGEECEFHVFW
jgi:hypothetical protein